MSRTKFKLSPLAVRKQLLLVESDLNRAQFANEYAALNDQVRGLTGEFQGLISTATALVSGVQAVRGLWSERRENKGSWFSKLFNVVRSGASAWSAFKSRPR